MESGMVFNIQKCSIHDGPGIRTLVFLKGCYLSCLWCANPESQNFRPEIMNFYSKCIGCKECISCCPRGAIYEGKKGYAIHRERCNGCNQCVDNCYAEAKKLMGKTMTSEEVMEEVRKDKAFYAGRNGGGVTFSGGEPFLQADFMKEVLENCKREGISTAVESCGFASFSEIKKVLPYLDFIFFDMKHYDSEQHKKLTGQGNEKILENLQRINEYSIPITVRTPVIPGYNDDETNIIEIAKICAKLPNVRQYELLAYHELGVSKYENLDRIYELKETKTPDVTEMEHLVKEANKVLKAKGKICFYKK